MTRLFVGDLVRLRYDDSIDNQEIIGKTVRVTSPPMEDAPNWMDVITPEGKAHSVRGGDCDRISRVVAGLDEVGRGAIAGPLVVCAAAFRLDGPWDPASTCPVPGVKDSKLFKGSKTRSPELQREEVAQALLAYPGLRGAGCGQVNAEEINEYGMVWAMRTAIQRALQGIKCEGRRVIPDLLLLDGNEKADGWSGFQQSMPKADVHWWPVSAASILAKVYRDRLMIEQGKSYPQFGFPKHKGYGTPVHVEALKKFGITALHRTTFVRSILGG